MVPFWLESLSPNLCLALNLDSLFFFFPADSTTIMSKGKASVVGGEGGDIPKEPCGGEGGPGGKIIGEVVVGLVVEGRVGLTVVGLDGLVGLTVVGRVGLAVVGLVGLNEVGLVGLVGRVGLEVVEDGGGAIEKLRCFLFLNFLMIKGYLVVECLILQGVTVVE